MEDWLKRFKFKRDWKSTKEMLGIIKHSYPHLPYAAVLSVLYHAEVMTFNSYGYARSYENDLYFDYDLSDDEFTEIMEHVTGRIPVPFDVLKNIDYQSITPISNNNQHNTSKSDWNAIISIGDADLSDVIIREHKK